jgi:hypothetical protein
MAAAMSFYMFRITYASCKALTHNTVTRSRQGGSELGARRLQLPQLRQPQGRRRAGPPLLLSPLLLLLLLLSLLLRLSSGVASHSAIWHCPYYQAAEIAGCGGTPPCSCLLLQQRRRCRLQVLHASQQPRSSSPVWHRRRPLDSRAAAAGEISTAGCWRKEGRLGERQLRCYRLQLAPQLSRILCPSSCCCRS